MDKNKDVFLHSLVVPAELGKAIAYSFKSLSASKMILWLFIVCQGYVRWGKCEVMYAGVFISTLSHSHFICVPQTDIHSYTRTIKLCSITVVSQKHVTDLLL